MAKIWEENKSFKANVDSIKILLLEMFPYPSGKIPYGTCKKLYNW